MNPPASIKTAAGKRLWRSGVREMQDRGVWRAADCAPLLERLVLNRVAAADALATAESEPIVTGSTGQPTAHPLYAVAARCDQIAMSLARLLTLAPTERPARERPEEPADPLEALDELAPRRKARSA